MTGVRKPKPWSADTASKRCVRSATRRTPLFTAPRDVEFEAVARRVLHTVSSERATWTRWNVVAETERVLRPMRFVSEQIRDQVTDAVVDVATGPTLAIRISEPALMVTEPDQLRRASDGQSVFVAHGSERYTTSRILNAEELLVAAGQPAGIGVVDPLVAEAALAVYEGSNKVRLDAGQRALVMAFATSTAQLALGIGPAGAGKTTAMRAFASVWGTAGGRVVPLASSSRAAEVLGHELGMRAENVHKFLHEITPRRALPESTTGSDYLPVTWSWSTRPAWPAPSSSPNSSSTPNRAARRFGCSATQPSWPPSRQAVH